MQKAIRVSPYDGGWCIKIGWTGEVLFFQSADFAERRALAIASEAHGFLPGVEVILQDRAGEVAGHWDGKGATSVA